VFYLTEPTTRSILWNWIKPGVILEVNMGRLILILCVLGDEVSSALFTLCEEGKGFSKNKKMERKEEVAQGDILVWLAISSANGFVYKCVKLTLFSPKILFFIKLKILS
jgi:hypothetical protein